MKKLVGAAMLCFMLALCAGAAAQTAKEITAECKFAGSPPKTIANARDGRYFSTWLANKGGALTISAPEGERIFGVYVQFSDQGHAFAVEVRSETGEWKEAASCDTDFLTGYASLADGAQEIRVRAKDPAARMSLAEVHVFSQGDTPEWVQRWQPPCEDADLLVISAHPDDEILFMGGTIPYYAGERKMDVQVAYLVPSMPYRELELLDGLWLCGVKNYPDLGPFPDRFKLTVKDMYKEKGWSESRVLRHVTGLYRRYKPEVVVTHDVNGEYGHGAHKVAADAAQRCIALAADASWQDKQLAYTDAWQISKLYLHLYEQGQLRMDWRVPLQVFGGKTAFDMAEAAFQCHVSQLKTDYRVEDFGPNDNAVFGLAFSAVGEDIEKNDFFENIAQ